MQDRHESPMFSELCESKPEPYPPLHHMTSISSYCRANNRQMVVISEQPDESWKTRIGNLFDRCFGRSSI